MSFLTIGGAMVTAGGGFRSEPVEQATPSAVTSGVVRAVNGNFVQTFVLGAAPAGYEWNVGYVTGPWRAVAAGTVDVVLGSEAGKRENAEAFLVDANGKQTQPVPLALTFPGGSIYPGPRVIGAIGPVQVEVGAGVSFNLRTVIDGTDLQWTCSEPSFALSQAGILVINTSVAINIPTVTVTATDPLGRSASVTFPCRVDAEPPSFISELQDIVATVDDVVEVDVGGVARGAGLQFSVDQAEWMFVGAGRLQVPTDAPLAATPVTVTITDSLGRTASQTFNVTIQAGEAPTVPTLLGSISDVTAVQNSAPPVIDVGAIVVPKTGLVWTSNRPAFPLAQDGKITLATDLLRNNALVRVTATDGLANFVEVEFRFTVTAAVGATLTCTTLPTFAPATAPGTALGSVWNSSGDVWAGGVAPVAIVSEFFRDGTKIPDPQGTGRAYTIAAADKAGPGNKVISNRVTATDSSTPPQAVTVNAVGAATIAPTVGPAFTVGNVADLNTAINTCLTRQGEQVIALSPGNWGELNLTNKTKVGANGPRSAAVGRAQGVMRNLENRIVLISAVKNNPARFFRTRWILRNIDGFIFDNIRYEDDSDDGLGFAKLGTQAINGQDLKNVTWRNCSWDGWCDNLAVTRSDWLTIEWNDLKGAGRDTVRLFSYQNELLVQNNDFDGFRADGRPGVDYTRSQQDEPNRHADFLSIQISNTAARGGVNLRILNNRMKGGNGYHQFLFCANSMLQQGNNDFNTYKTTGLTVDGNWFEGCHVNNTYISGCENFILRNHLAKRITPVPPGGYWNTTALGQPTVVLAGRSTGQITDVVAHRVIKLDGNMPQAHFNANVNVTRYDVDTTGNVRPATLQVPPPVGRFGYEGAAAPDVLSVAITPLTGPAQTTFTGSSTTQGAASILDEFYRNGALQTAPGVVYTGAAGQLGRIEYRVRAVGQNGAVSAPKSAYARMGRAQPWDIGQTLIDGITTPGGESRVPTVPLAAQAGDTVYVFISAPKRAGGPGGTNPQSIVWATGFTQIDQLVEPQAPIAVGGDVTDYLCGWAKHTLTAGEVATRTLPAQFVGFHGMATYTFLRDAVGEVWTAAEHVSRISTGRDCPLLPESRTVDTCFMLVAVAGSDYPNNARRARMTPAMAAGTSDYLLGEISTNAGQIGAGRWHGHNVMTRLVGGGSPAQKTVGPNPALTRDESITVCVMEVLGPA